MRLIAPVMGGVAARVSNDDVMPPRGVLQRDIVALLAEHYMFNVVPQTGPGTAPSPILQFQSGIFTGSPSGPIPIPQIMVFPDGDIVMAKNTDLAEVVLDDLLEQFDSQLGYRYSQSEIKHSYLSHVTVEFDRIFVERTAVFAAAQRVINDAIHNSESYCLKKFSFGFDPASDVSQAMQPAISVERFFVPDFAIERRAAEPMEKNRFFCTAPMKTNDHVRALDEFERAVIAA